MACADIAECDGVMGTVPIDSIVETAVVEGSVC